MANEAADLIPRDEEDEGDTKMVEWRGNSVPEKKAKALIHVFDELKDHFGHQNSDPMLRVSVANLSHAGHGQWLGNLDFTYDINDDYCNLGFVGMDVCIDLNRKLMTRNGAPMLKDYGKTWVYVYLPQETLERFYQYVKTGTGWSVTPNGTAVDYNRNLVAIEAKLHNESGQPKPSFWVTKDKAGSEEEMSFNRIGDVQEVSQTYEQQRVHRGVGIFSISIDVEGSKNVAPTPSTREEANLSFTVSNDRNV